jgi:predicted RNase H-like nuclease
VVALWDDGGLTLRHCAHLRELDHMIDLELVAIDIPLGLTETGERTCDRLARRHLAGRASTLFNAPPRACLDPKVDYHRANQMSRERAGRGLSRQSFALRDKIREADDYWPTASAPLVEVHPELVFTRLNEGRRLASKKSWAGLLERRALLANRGVILDQLGRDLSNVAADDVLDAIACAVAARSIMQGDAHCLPDTPEFDDTGREMAIRY